MKRKLKRYLRHIAFIMKHRFINALSIKSLRGGFRLLMLLSIVQAVVIAGLVLKIKSDSEIIESRNNEIVQLTSERNYYITSCANLGNALIESINISEALDETNKQLINDNLEINEELNVFREREELYDKYEYALYFNGDRTDLTYDQLLTLQDMVKDTSIPSVDMILAICMHESHFNASAVNGSGSGASGYGQFLPSTARSVWSNILGNDPDDWEPEYIFDPDINLQMCVAYTDYLIKKHGGPRGAMQQYSGGGGDGYIAALDIYLRRSETGSFANLEAMYQASR